MGNIICQYCECGNNQHMFNCVTLEKTPFLQNEENKEDVLSFRGEFRFLSNFWPAQVKIYGIDYPTVEHAYQAAKTEILSEREFIFNAKTPFEAKKISHKLTVRSNWENLKLGIMEGLLRQKFSEGTDLLEKLKNIKGQIIEGNVWCDNFYGICVCAKCNGIGENNLGKLLMKIRDEFLERKVNII